MILGLSGTNASGKDLLAEFLRDNHNFLFFHTSEYIRQEAKKRYGNILRPTLFKVGNELRQEGGAGVLAEMGIDEYKSNSNSDGVVISSIRTIGEVDVIHQAGGKIAFIDANRKIRYERIQKRLRDDDQIDFKTFVEQEEAELFESDDPAKFNILGVKSRADYLLTNEDGISTFTDAATEALSL